MEIDVYAQGKRFTARTVKALNDVLRWFKGWARGTEITPQELTHIRLQIILGMLEADPKLKSILKLYL